MNQSINSSEGGREDQAASHSELISYRAEQQQLVGSTEREEVGGWDQHQEETRVAAAAEHSSQQDVCDVEVPI